MIKFIQVCVFILAAINCFSQTQFRIRVLDSETREPVEKAMIFIEELPTGEIGTDENGQAVFQNVPIDRKVRIHIRKVGYASMQTEIVASEDIKSDNNVVITLKKSLDDSEIIIWGYVYDKQNSVLSNAIIDFNFAGHIYRVTSEPNGNYRVSIRKDEIVGVKSFRAIAKTGECETTVIDRPIPETIISNIDFRLDCYTNTSKSYRNSSVENYRKEDLDGIWKMTLVTYQYLSAGNKQMIKHEGVVTLGIKLEFDQQDVVGKYLYLESGGHCMETLIEGTLINGILNFEVLHLGNCCGGLKMKVIAEMNSQQIFKGTYGPSSLENPVCDLWYANVTIEKE